MFSKISAVSSSTVAASRKLLAPRNGMPNKVSGGMPVMP